MGYLKTAPKRYFIEVMAGTVLFLTAGALRGFALHHTTDPVLLVAAKLLPLPPILLIVLAVWRLYRSRDEFQRQTMLKTVAAAAILSLLFFVLLPFLSQLGLPPIPQHFPLASLAVLVLSFSYIIAGLVVSYLDKRAEMGTSRALLGIAPMLAAFFLPLAYWSLTLILPLPSISFWGGMFIFAAACMAGGFYRIFVRPTEQ